MPFTINLALFKLYIFIIYNNILLLYTAMSLKDFQILNKLGQGAYSSVYRVQRLADQTQYALKKVKLNNLSQKQQENALNQVRILASIHNVNIIGYKQAFIQNNNLCIIMQFANDGDLYQKIVDQKKKNQLFQQNEIWNVLLQITKGLKTLHSLNIFHRDLKSANVFLTKNGIAKLGDMNVSKIAKNGLLYTQTGTPYYASPEVWKDQPYDSKSDIWSLGCVIYQMTTLKPPFRAEDMQGLFKKVVKGVYPKISNQYSIDLSNVIRALLQVNPNLRPSSEKLLQTSIFKKKLEEYNIDKQQISTEGNLQLLKTIRVPKNLHYLTDRLPKANYMTAFTKQFQKTNFKRSQTLEKQSNLPRIETLGNHPNNNNNPYKDISIGNNNKRLVKNNVLELEGYSKVNTQSKKDKKQGQIAIAAQIQKLYNMRSNTRKVIVYKSSHKNVSLPPLK